MPEPTEEQRKELNGIFEPIVKRFEANEAEIRQLKQRLEQLDRNNKGEISGDPVDEQVRFVEWLKDRDMYNPMESADTMRKMHRVWKAATANPPQKTPQKPQQSEISQ